MKIIKKYLRKKTMEDFLKTIGMLIIVGLANAMSELMPLLLLAMSFVILHAVTEFRMIKRVGKLKNIKVPQKMSSEKFGKTVIELMFIIPIGLLISHFTQTYLFEDLNLRLPNIFAGAIIAFQFWSILENESTGTNSRWAKILQRILIDKTEQKFGISLDELKKDNDENKNE